MRHFLASICVLAAGLIEVPPARAEVVDPVKAAVFRSTGTQFLGQTIWPELNAGWSQFGNVPVEIDWWSLAGSNITQVKLEASGADVIILSNPAFLTYTSDEITALRQYVEAGHGLIISYGKFRSEDRALAPLVGLSETITLGTGTAINPIQFELLDPAHPLFAGVGEPYVSGVPFRARPLAGEPWPIDGGFVLANQFTSGFPPQPGIIARETTDYRGLYFSHYIENKTDGANQQDMQVFYNGLLWTAGVPEPTTAMLFLGAGLLALKRRRETSPMLDHSQIA